MAHSVLLHLANEDPVLCEVENLPGPQDVTLVIHNPRRRDGKDLHYILSTVTTVIFPLSRIAFIEVLPSKEEEQIFGLVRE